MIIEDKKDKDLIQNILGRIHDRRLAFLYGGLTSDPKEIVLFSHKESAIKSSDSLMSMCLIQIKDDRAAELLQKIFKFFLVDIGGPCPCIISVRAILSTLSKYKWDVTRISTEKGARSNSYRMHLPSDNPSEDPKVEYYGADMITYFTKLSIEPHLQIIRKGIDGKCPLFDVPVSAEASTAPILSILLSASDFKGTEFEKRFPKDKRFVALKGFDYFCPKTLIQRKVKGTVSEDAYVNSVRLWKYGETEMCYGGYFDHELFRAVTLRVGSFLM